MNDIKKKVIIKSIKLCEKKLKNLDEFLHANPLTEIVRIRSSTLDSIEKHQNGLISLHELINAMNENEQKTEIQMALYKKSKNTCKLIEKKVKLYMELSNLKSELYWIENRL
jgi:hypothetical protein